MGSDGMTVQAIQAPSEAAFGIFKWQRDYALKTLEAYKTEVEGRVFPAFGQESRTDTPLPEEALDGDADPEAQREAFAKSYEENEYRKDLEFAKSRIVEMAIAGLYHLWERRVTHLLRTYERGQPGAGTPKQEMTDLYLGTFAQIRDEFEKLGWSLETQDCYKKLNQLRLVTNAVKHGDGDSRTRLWRKFPRLFWPYNHDSYPIPEDVPTVPTAANTLELTPEHFKEYAEAVEAFWKAVPSLDRT
jgi:hypothetical protein